MNLPHLYKDQLDQEADGSKSSLGPKSMRALSQPIVVRSRTTPDILPDQLGMNLDNVIAPPDPASSWRTLEVQRKNLLNLPYTRLSALALDLSPQINKGLWDFVGYGNPGSIVKDRRSNMRAEDASNEFLHRVGTYYGSFNNHLDSMWADIFVYGGLFLKLQLDPAGRYPVDLGIIDPLSVRFAIRQDPIRQQIVEMGQQTRQGFVSYEKNPLVRYIGFQRIGNNRYGRPLIAPAVHSALFLLGLISDLRRMVANQGLSRMDYVLEAEEILRLIDRNPDIAGDDEATAQFIADQIDSIGTVLASLDVDEDYVHLSTVSVNYATNPSTLNFDGLDALIDKLQLDVVNGMKSVSALSSILNSTTETHITRQLQYFVGALKSVQDEMASVLTDFLQIANQVQGIRSQVFFEFLEHEIYSPKELAEVKEIETDTAIKQLEADIIDLSEAREQLGLEVSDAP